MREAEPIKAQARRCFETDEQIKNRKFKRFLLMNY